MIGELRHFKYDLEYWIKRIYWLKDCLIGRHCYMGFTCIICNKKI